MTLLVAIFTERRYLNFYFSESPVAVVFFESREHIGRAPLRYGSPKYNFGFPVSFELNYRGFLGSCIFLKLIAFVDIFQVQANCIGIFVEKLCQLLLGQPEDCRIILG